jgi:hypothetical protein
VLTIFQIEDTPKGSENTQHSSINNLSPQKKIFDLNGNDKKWRTIAIEEFNLNMNLSHNARYYS